MHQHSNNNFDVAVVGTGPAGSTAALDLARAVLAVVIIDKASPPRYKTCGGGLLRRAARLLPPGVGCVIDRECCTAELRFHDQGLRFWTTRTEPIVSMTMRADLDHLLLSTAQQAGAELMAGCAVTEVQPGPDHVCLHTARGRVRSRFLIGADGANSFVARKLGWPDGRTLIPALECETRVDDASFARLNRTVRFDFNIPPRGYAWVFPKPDHLAIGVLSMRQERFRGRGGGSISTGRSKNI